MFIVTSSFCFAFITDVLLAEIRCGPLQTYLEINKVPTFFLSIPRNWFVILNQNLTITNQCDTNAETLQIFFDKYLLPS